CRSAAIAGHRSRLHGARARPQRGERPRRAVGVYAVFGRVRVLAVDDRLGQAVPARPARALRPGPDAHLPVVADGSVLVQAPADTTLHAWATHVHAHAATWPGRRP